MLPRLRDRWRRRLDLDQVRPKRGVLAEQVSHVFDIIDDGSRRPLELLLRYVLLQAMADRAWGIHFFYDEDDSCIRMLYCLALPGDRTHGPLTPSQLPLDDPRPAAIGLPAEELVQPDPTNPAYERVWYEMVPPPVGVAPRLFPLLRWYGHLEAGATEGKLAIRLERRDVSATVVAPRPEDLRIFFGSEHPAIRPKLKRHFEELGLPYPGSQNAHAGR
jgi:hypothetical protein